MILDWLLLLPTRLRKNYQINWSRNGGDIGIDLTWLKIFLINLRRLEKRKAERTANQTEAEKARCDDAVIDKNVVELVAKADSSEEVLVTVQSEPSHQDVNSITVEETVDVAEKVTEKVSDMIGKR